MSIGTLHKSVGRQLAFQVCAKVLLLTDSHAMHNLHPTTFPSLLQGSSVKTLIVLSDR